jgi:translation elongation factor EF-1beta
MSKFLKVSLNICFIRKVKCSISTLFHNKVKITFLLSDKRMEINLKFKYFLLTTLFYYFIKEPEVIAKSSVLLDCKPWDDETDMAAFEAKVRTIEMDGLIWGASKLIPVAYGLKKLQIGCVIEDDKVSTEVLEEKICEFEDYCQSVDIAAFNKI